MNPPAFETSATVCALYRRHARGRHAHRRLFDTRISRACAAVLLSLVCLAATSAAGAEDWPEWRGTKRDGRVAGFKAPTPWPAELDRHWQVEVGLGHSSPVVAEDRVFAFTRQNEEEVAACFNLADGKPIWRQAYPAPYELNKEAAAHGKGPKSTPVVNDGRLFTLGISGIVTCWDAKTGKRHWQKDFTKQFDRTSPLYGVAMSPICVRGKLIVQVGGPDKGALVALDEHSGEEVWTSGADGPAYASPVLAELSETRQLIVQSQTLCFGAAPADGALLWKIPFKTEFDQNAVTPLTPDDGVVISGYNRGVERYRIEKQADEWRTDKLWENKEVSMYMSSPVANGERMFGFSHRQKGQLFALDLTTGKTLWTGEGRLADNASLLLAGAQVFALTTKGELIVFADNEKQFEQLARWQVADTATWASPVLLSSGVLVKDESKLTLWSFQKK